ncbi:MAG: pyruvate kinase [Candidatus Omnitrophota bacterium]
MKRKALITCTLGPASETVPMIRKLAEEGMNIARLNFSHGDHAYHEKLIRNIRRVNEQRRQKILIMQDLEGYRIRVGCLKVPLELREGSSYSLTVAEEGGPRTIPLDADFEMTSLRQGMDVFIADGTIHLKVIKMLKQSVKVRVLHGGTITSKKNVNIPGMKLRGNIFTAKDQTDLAFGIEHGVDFVAQSFVRNRRDVERVIEQVRPRLPRCRIIAKLENAEALRNMNAIIDASDGIIVARGDLGVAMPIYEIPILQKKILARSNKVQKFDIVATQMLESMTEHARPTRAEVSDVANAILDGADSVMLSGETAMGRFPVEAVRMMRKTIEFAERSAAKYQWICLAGRKS